MHDPGHGAVEVVLVAGAGTVRGDRDDRASEDVELPAPLTTDGVGGRDHPALGVDLERRRVALRVRGGDQVADRVEHVAVPAAVGRHDRVDVAEQVPLEADLGSLAVGEDVETAVVAVAGRPGHPRRVDGGQRTTGVGVVEGGRTLADDRLDEATGGVVDQRGGATRAVDELDRQTGGVVAELGAIAEGVDPGGQLTVGVPLELRGDPVGVDDLDRQVGVADVDGDGRTVGTDDPRRPAVAVHVVVGRLAIRCDASRRPGGPVRPTPTARTDRRDRPDR